MPDPRDHERALFERHRCRHDPWIRERLVERYLPLVRHLVARFEHVGRSDEDLFQVACLALVKAVDRFDPDRGVAFSSYAVPTIVGEMKRYLRDATWAVHVPRELQERSLRTRRATAELSRRLGRQPTVGEVASALGRPTDDVLEALRAANACRATSLEAARTDDEPGALGPTIGRDDDRLATVERRADLGPLVGRLSRTERAALLLRFELDLTHAEIAGHLGVSPMEVSRILRRALERLRMLEAREAA